MLSFQTVHSVQGVNEYKVLQCTLLIHLLIQFLLRPVWVRADRVTVNSELERVRQYIVLYKLHVIDTFVCGSFFLSCFYDNLYNMVIMNNYSYDTFLYYNAIIFYSTNII